MKRHFLILVFSLLFFPITQGKVKLSAMMGNHMVRLDKVEEVMNAVYAKDSGRKAQVYAFDKNSYRLPIPQSVIDANDKIQQNPGY